MSARRFLGSVSVSFCSKVLVVHWMVAWRPELPGEGALNRSNVDVDFAIWCPKDQLLPQGLQSALQIWELQYFVF